MAGKGDKKTMNRKKGFLGGDFWVVGRKKRRKKRQVQKKYGVQKKRRDGGGGVKKDRSKKDEGRKNDGIRKKNDGNINICRKKTGAEKIMEAEKSRGRTIH